MDWKNRLERTIGINTAIMKAEQNNFLNKKVIDDLSLKNKALHECAYTAYTRISELINENEFSATDYREELRKLQSKMEEILSERDNSEQALEHVNNPKGIITI